MNEKPKECECCRFETGELKLYSGLWGSLDGGRTPISAWYCDLCASTQASTADRYTALYSSDYREILKTICYIGNAVIAAVKTR